MNKFIELYRYRMMIESLVRRDLRGRYKGSSLGFLWTFVNPLLQLLVYTVVFANILRMGVEHYEIFLFVTLIPWIFFSTSLLASANCILGNQSLVTKIYFPREVLPISIVISGFINMLLSFIIVLAVVVVSGISTNYVLWGYIPILMIIELVLTLGFAFILSAATVYLRDIEHILGIFLLAWQFLTPVMYPADLIPTEYISFFALNPMMPIIIAFRDILYYGVAPDFASLLSAFLTSLVILILGLWIFNKLSKGFAEEL